MMTSPPQLQVIIPISFLYVLIFVISLVGNIVTCIVISRRRCMHTATNYYLFSLAVSDLLLLLTSLPFEIVDIWKPHQTGELGETFCILRGLCAETSTNASILTIVAFTVERYLAICHPLLQHTFSRLSRAIKNIAVIWFVALVCALFPALQFGIRHQKDAEGFIVPDTGVCSIIRHTLPYVFEISTIVFFIAPMFVISCLYVRIGRKLKKHAGQSALRGSQFGHLKRRPSTARNSVIHMLVAVVVAFFICWAPFHSQRLLAIHAPRKPSPALLNLFQCLHYTSGVLYFFSTCINPILYHTMSAKFRKSLTEVCSGSNLRGACFHGTTEQKATQRWCATVRNTSVPRSSSGRGRLVATTTL